MTVADTRIERTLADAFAEFESANERNWPPLPGEPEFFGEALPFGIPEHRARCYDALAILEEREVDPYTLEHAELIVSDCCLTPEEILSVSAEELADRLERMASDADVDGEYDEDGIGHAWVVPGMSFADAAAVAVFEARPVCATPPRQAVRAPRSRRRARTTRRARSPGRPDDGDGEPSPPDLAPRSGAVVT